MPSLAERSVVEGTVTKQTSMEIVIGILAVLAGIIGILGSILPALPGPPLSWIGMLLLYFWGGTNGRGEEMSLTILLVMLGATILVSVLDYLIPSYLTRATGGSKAAERGTLIGMFIGIFVLPPWGMIIFSFLGAFLAEIIFEKKEGTAALKSAFGAFLGFIVGTGIKLIACGVMMYYIIVYL